jgi:hypothetical protein
VPPVATVRVSRTSPATDRIAGAPSAPKENSPKLASPAVRRLSAIPSATFTA